MYLQKHQSKYHNVRQQYGGYAYASKKEANRAFELDMLLRAKEIKSWKKQITLPLYFKDIKVCDYRIDFIKYELTGDIVLEEVKGFATDSWRYKRNMLDAILSYPKSSEYKKIARVIGAKKNQEIKYEVLQ